MLNDWSMVTEHALMYTTRDTTLQELKLQGTQIRDGVVLSRYSQNKWFANNLSTFWTGEQPAP